mgnify:FL=1
MLTVNGKSYTITLKLMQKYPNLNDLEQYFINKAKGAK